MLPSSLKRQSSKSVKAAKHNKRKTSNGHINIWGIIKTLLFLISIMSIVFNYWVLKQLRQSIIEDKIGSVLDTNEDKEALRDSTGAEVSGNEEQDMQENEKLINEGSTSDNADSSHISVQRITDIEKLIEKSERTIRPPNKRYKVVVLGKSFILKRDYDIWEYTFKRASHDILQTTKQDLQQGKHPDWTVMKCLDLFDGKSHCIEPSDLPGLMRYQRISRLYGLRKTLWNKDRFCETMATAVRGFGHTDEFFFPCWVLPADYSHLIHESKTIYSNKSFILKPTDRGEGNGIIVMDDWKQLVNWKSKFPDNDEIVVQTYLPNPFLINQRKWDMRTYVLVTSISPLRVYMYRDGLVRFASSKYEKDAKAGGKATSFLTNTSVNKKAGVAVEDLTWPFPQVYTYLKGIGIEPELLWERIERAVVQVLLASEPAFVRHFKKLQNDFHCSNCYQLLGVDVIVDDDLTPRIIEVNGEPSMQLSGETHSQYDFTKKSMTRDVVSMIFNLDSFSRSIVQDLTELELAGFSIGYQSLGCSTNDEICLRPADIEYLLESKKEQQNMGGFRRMYPHAQGDYYSKFISHLETKFPYGSATGTFKLHKLVTELEKLSQVKTKNHWLDAVYNPEKDTEFDAKPSSI